METAISLASMNSDKAKMVAVTVLAKNLKRPLVYVDVGALWGVDNHLVNSLNLMGFVKIIGFEPDENECAKLRGQNSNNTYLSVGVGDEDCLRKFYITTFNACSSFLEPDLAALAGAPHRDLFHVTRTVEIPMRRLESLLVEGAIQQPDFLKIDAQGFELNILNGCGSCLDNIIGIRLETQFRPVYKGQATFGDIYSFLSKRKFILRDLRLTNSFGYECIEAEAFFSRDPSRREHTTEMTIWDLIHDIRPGQTVEIKDGRCNFMMLQF